jgi:serine/threonine protein kinase
LQKYCVKALQMTNSRYHILGEVGQGQFGQVFCGSDRTTGELVALKNLDHRRFKTRNFLRELAVLVRLDHPNIVRFHALEYNSKGRYIVMDYCQGGTLRHLMESKLELSLAQKLQIIQDILCGLEHVHNQNVIHCDLKPENILLNVTAQGWTAQIADFGIAHFNEKKEESESTGNTGSPAYMAPERFYGKFSPASDLYAVGVILYELISGKRPFSGMPVEVMNAHFNHPLRIPKSVPIMLKAVIRKALQKLPQNRYTSAAQMQLALETAIATLEHTIPTIEPEEEEPEDDTKKEWASQNALQTPPRWMGLQSNHLQHCFETPDSILHLWVRPQGCFIVTDGTNGLTVFLVQPDGSQQSIGILPSLKSASEAVCMDLDPLGRWLAIAYPSSNPAVENLDERITSSILEILKLPNLQPICKKSIDSSVKHLWVSSSRHLLMDCSSSTPPSERMEKLQPLQLWNRRGQFYWSYHFPAKIQQAVLNPMKRDRLFAIADRDRTTGLLMDLCPFKVKRIPIEIRSDWIGAAHWGYILVNREGRVVCLNRRGKVMAQAELPFQQESEKVRAIGTSQPATLWLATQKGDRNTLYTLDLSPHLPKSLLRL